MEERAGVEARATKFMQRKKAAMHALEAEQKERARTADPPARGQVQQAVQKIEASGMKPAREMSPRLRKKVSIPPDAFMSRQRVGVEGGMIRRYRGR